MGAANQSNELATSPATRGLRPGIGAMGVCVTSVLGLTTAHADSATADSTSTDGSSSKSLQEVTITGVRSLLHEKLADDPQDTPQSLTLVSERLMQAQAATRLEDALKNVPGITLNAGEGAARGDTVNLRGFSAFNDFFLDGVRDAAIYTRDSFNLQAVEVVKGPSAVLFGRGSTGGAINQVTKAPMLTPLQSVTANLGTNDLYRATTDLNVPVGAATAFRLNGMAESSQAAERDEVRNRRWGVAPSLAFGLGEDDTLVLAYLHQQEHNVPDPGIPFVNGRPAPVPRDAYFGLASDRVATRDDIGTARCKHDFSSTLSIADTVRYAHYEFSYIDNLPNFGRNPPTAGTPLSSILVGRDAPASAGTQSNLTNQIDVTAEIATGPVTHRVVTGVEVARQTFNLNRYTNPFNSNNTWVPLTPLLDPDPNEIEPPQPISQNQNTVARSSALYVTDTMALSRYVDLAAGARYDRFSADYLQTALATGARLALNHVDRLGSPRAALIVKPTPMQSYYVSFGTSFDPSAEALSLTTKTANLGPVKAHTYEAGAKLGVLDGNVSLTGAVFRTEVDNAQTNDPENPTVTVLNGDQRVDGLELSVSGYLTQKWELFGGYTHLDPKTLSSGTPGLVGKEMPNVARNALNLWSEYEFSDALEIGAGGNWLGARFADSAETARIPGYVVWNAMVSYKVTADVQVQLNGLNLFNRLYFDAPYYTSVSENHVIMGPGRSVSLNLRMKF